MAPSSPRDHRAVSPWAQVAAAGAASPSSPPPPPAAAAAAVATVSNDPDTSEGLENNGSERKTAWSKPANGVSKVGPVMGAASWPALGESSKVAVQKSLSSDPITAPPAPAPVAVPSHHQQVNPNSSNTNPNPRPQRHMRRGGSFNNNHHGPMANGGHIPSAPVERPPQILPEKPAVQGNEPSPRNNNSNWDHGYSSRGTGLSPHSHGGPDHHRPFNRRGNNGSSSGPHNGGSSGPHNGGGRRDPDRGGYANDWNNPPPRHLAPAPLRGHHPRFPIIRSPPPPPPGAAAPFVAPPPPPIRSFVAPPMAFPAEIPPPPPFFYVPASPPFVAAHHPVAHAIAPAMLLNSTDTLRTDVLRQIEYYFSNENLVKDMYLRQKMDEQGWVPVTLIAGFNRVLMLTKHIPNSAAYILDSLRTSELLEVQGEMIRRRGDWANWLPRSQSSHQGSLAAANVDSVVDHMQNAMLGERTSNNSSGGSSDR